MLVDNFDELWMARPFKPFSLCTADGREIHIRGPEFAWHAPANRIVWVAEGPGESRVRMVDLHLVSSMVVEGQVLLPSSDVDAA